MSVVDMPGSEVIDIVRLWDFCDMSVPEVLDEFYTKLIWDRSQIVNDELQYYCDPRNPDHYNPFSTDSDGLHITARKRQPDENYTTQDWLSGILTTKDSPFNPERGEDFRVSALLRMPEGAGIWPAFWSLPQFQNWPKGINILPELDPLEYLGWPDQFCSNCHTRADTGLDLVENKYRHVFPGIDMLTFNWIHLERSDGMTRYGFNDMWVKEFLTPFDLQGALHFLLNLAIGGWAKTETGETDRETYTLSCQKMLVQKVEPAWATGPNKDLIHKLEGFRNSQTSCVAAPINNWIDELKR